jgi:hypothetical protein
VKFSSTETQIELNATDPMKILIPECLKPLNFRYFEFFSILLMHDHYEKVMFFIPETIPVTASININLYTFSLT